MNNEPMTPGELLPCPFCGSNNISASFSYGNDQCKKALFIECENCAAFGPSMDLPEGDEDDAIEAWNKRYIAQAAIAADPEKAKLEAEVRRLRALPFDGDNRVFFYEHNFYVLSNFSSFNLKWRGLTFATSEAAYHWEKFKGTFPRRQDICGAILAAPSAHEAFKIAEREKANRRGDWDLIKVPIMRAILWEKAAQHEYVRRKLLATDDRELIENSRRDDFWGWGPNRDGQNMLGKLWMDIRAELRKGLA